MQIWTLINYLPISTSKAAAEQRTLQAEYLKIRREMSATSSQDEFAKWAKLRRQHDKKLEQLDAASMCLPSRFTLPLSLPGDEVEEEKNWNQENYFTWGTRADILVIATYRERTRGSPIPF